MNEKDTKLIAQWIQSKSDLEMAKDEEFRLRGLIASNIMDNSNSKNFLKVRHEDTEVTFKRTVSYKLENREKFFNMYPSMSRPEQEIFKVTATISKPKYEKLTATSKELLSDIVRKYTSPPSPTIEYIKKRPVTDGNDK